MVEIVSDKLSNQFLPVNVKTSTISNTTSRTLDNTTSRTLDNTTSRTLDNTESHKPVVSSSASSSEEPSVNTKSHNLLDDIESHLHNPLVASSSASASSGGNTKKNSKYKKRITYKNNYKYKKRITSKNKYKKRKNTKRN